MRSTPDGSPVRMDRCRIKPILDYFGERKLSEISTLSVEKYRLERLRTLVPDGELRLGMDCHLPWIPNVSAIPGSSHQTMTWRLCIFVFPELGLGLAASDTPLQTPLPEERNILREAQVDLAEVKLAKVVNGTTFPSFNLPMDKYWNAPSQETSNCTRPVASVKR